MDGTQVATVVGVVTSIVTFLTLVINIVNTNYKEARNRRWAQEDKEELAKVTRHKMAETAQAMQFQFDEMKALQREIKEAGEERLRQIVAKVEGVDKNVLDNTQISVKAFDTANNVNEKIAAIGVQIRDKVVSGVNPQPQEVVVVNHNPIEVTETKANAKSHSRAV